MQFIDEVNIEVTAGRGGDGCVSFLRQRNRPRGGPDGGNGGRGGNIYLVVEQGLNTLVDYRYKRVFRAKNGRPGEGSQKTGQSAEDMYLSVPPGIVVMDSEKGAMLGELLKPQQQLLVARGGNPGRGNMSFVSSSNRKPYQCTKGTLGENRMLRLELKILADVGVVGMPNAGKSSLIRQLSAATPRVADYPFTTLVPRLGLLRQDDREIVFADIPGLIKGSAAGKGLGNQFLRHIHRTSLLWHVVDLAPAQRSPVENFFAVQRELACCDYPQIMEKPVWIILNKIDLLSPQQRQQAAAEFARATKGRIPVYLVSAVTGEGCDVPAGAALDLVQATANHADCG